MAPTKAQKPLVPQITSRCSMNTRSKSTILSKDINSRTKRKADGSPTKETAVKRSAFGDLTNALSGINAVVEKTKNTVAKKVIVRTKTLPTARTAVVKVKQTENVDPQVIAAANTLAKIATRHAAAASFSQQPPALQKVKETTATNAITNKKSNELKVKTRLSNEFEKSEVSLYSSALENLNLSSQSDQEKLRSTSDKESSISPILKQIGKSTFTKGITLNIGNHEVPDGVSDFDKENWDDIFQVSHYAKDVFNYYKSREPLFAIKDYMNKQVTLTTWMRSMLVDWMVEVQESFELNHETLYLGVKLVDLYLSKEVVSKENLQLVGAASMFIASKFDERMPPLVDDFLYICDGAYTRRKLLRMEISILKTCDFDLGIPISYRFLRRYARCAKQTMPVLTLARFILEYSLMDYASIMIRDSMLASGALYLALRMKKVGGWTPVLEHYTGYRLEQFLHVVILLNNWLHRKLSPQINTIKNKYSHKIFFEVAKVPLLSNDELRTDIS